jgi:hypothetical protein
MNFLKNLFKEKAPPTKEEESNAKLYSKFRATIPCQKVSFSKICFQFMPSNSFILFYFISQPYL